MTSKRPRDTEVITQYKETQTLPVGKSIADLDKELIDLFKLLVKKDSFSLHVVFFSFKVIPKFAKSDYHL